MENENSESQNLYAKMFYVLHKEVLTFEEGCFYLGRKASFMYKLTSAKLITYYQPTGKVIYFKRVELDAWALQKKQKTVKELLEESQSFLRKPHH